MCQIYQYKFIDKTKNWRDAKHHCRRQYTDLATVYDMTDMKAMEQLSGGDAWIGLNRRGNVNTWKWSDGSSSTFRLNSVNKASGGKCVSTQSGEWSSAPCNELKPFFCYKDKMKLIDEEKTWEEALDYCREKHDDLVSITDQAQQESVQNKVGTARTPFIWLGLRYTCTLNIWFWVNGEVLNYDNWNSTQSPDCYSAAAMNTTDYKWVKQMDNETFNFICVK
ncbi:snaclec stejaggregin-B subunit beta-1-like [Pleuronectes platessa]|uniref:snaclec stejaggregin-B subunit beta-1-like n=1 Tax=Pleuronectes platessa TaxID=8262 RepID=UPI00232A6001|nr:snaclec stejaggregin-B subunit beta-1-like [Pleuronectes platessa]